MKHSIASVPLLLCFLMPAPIAAGQEWEVFFDSEGFEELPYGPAPRFPDFYPQLFPHRLDGSGTFLPEVVPAPDPGFGARSVFFSASGASTESSFGYFHHYEQFGKAFFSFPGHASRGGYRGLRVSFDMLHVFDPLRGALGWHIGGVWGGKPFAIGPGYAQLIWDVTERIEPVYDEWVHVTLSYDFENKLFSGSYGDHEEGPLPLPSHLQEMGGWAFWVTPAAPCDCPEPVVDVESAWLDNLVIEVIPPCPADCDLDYEHTFFDFLCFQNLFARGNMRADCDLDGELTFFDFICFQEYFAAGCD